MPSPANSSGSDAPVPELPVPPRRAARRRWVWAVVVLLIITPLFLTAAGVVTAPPRAAHVPAGRIVFLEADEPSEHTSLLRGLRITLPGSSNSREILHEAEPQDVDAGSRDWLTQPAISPDGHWLAYEKQLITLQEETTGIVNQLWALPLDDPHAVPHLLADLTVRHLKQPIGLAWTPGGTHVVFLEDALRYTVNVQGTPRLTMGILPGLLPLRTTPTLSATRRPAYVGLYDLALEAQTTQGSQIVVVSDGGRRPVVFAKPAPSVWTVMPDRRFAVTTVPSGHGIVVLPAPNSRMPPVTLHARWGWSVFGGRRITSLKWSPEGRYLGYTVSKPPFEDELFYADTQTGKCYQLPIRTGRAAWDWTR